MSNKNEIEKNNGLVVGENKGNIINNNANFTLAEFRPYIEEVVKYEIEKYKNKALETATMRDNEFVVAVFNKLNQLDTRIDKVQEALSSPSMQFDLIEAEKGYIKNGSEHLLNILGELIAERVNCNEATLGQIMLSEAIKTAPLLLDKQLDILALMFSIGYSSISGIRTLPNLYYALSTFYLPLCSSVEYINDLDFGHLDFTRCSIKGIVSRSLYDLLWHKYTSAFYLPFSYQELEMAQFDGQSLNKWFPEVFSYSNHMVSFSSNNYYVFSKLVNSHSDVSEAIKKEMIEFYKNHCVNVSKSVEYLIEKYPDLKPIVDMWNKISFINLSSIGMVIGAIHAKNKTPLYIDLHGLIY